MVHQYPHPHRDGSIGRITTAGKITTYTSPSIVNPQEITAGPDAALWFTDEYSDPGEIGGGLIGRITTTGKATHCTNVSIRGPDGITAGPDGALWFTNPGGNAIGRITTSGTSQIRTSPRRAQQKGLDNQPRLIPVGRSLPLAPEPSSPPRQPHGPREDREVVSRDRLRSGTVFEIVRLAWQRTTDQ